MAMESYIHLSTKFIFWRAYECCLENLLVSFCMVICVSVSVPGIYITDQFIYSALSSDDILIILYLII